MIMMNAFRYDTIKTVKACNLRIDEKIFAWKEMMGSQGVHQEDERHSFTVPPHFLRFVEINSTIIL